MAQLEPFGQCMTRQDAASKQEIPPMIWHCLECILGSNELGLYTKTGFYHPSTYQINFYAPPRFDGRADGDTLNVGQKIIRLSNSYYYYASATGDRVPGRSSNKLTCYSATPGPFCTVSDLHLIGVTKKPRSDRITQRVVHLTSVAIENWTLQTPIQTAGYRCLSLNHSLFSQHYHRCPNWPYMASLL